MKNNVKNADEVFNFPCEYPIKVFGKKCHELKPTICQIISNSSGEIHANSINQRLSSNGNYIVYTIRIIATSRAQIDTINSTLAAHPLVAYIL